jgi:RNA-directed DNA polymerase
MGKPAETDRPYLPSLSHSFTLDFVICFQYREDAERVLEVLRKRLEKFALALEPSKTKLIEFGRFAERDARARGQRPATLYFLGFTHYCTRNRKGNFKVGRKTEKSRLRRSLARLEELMREIRHESVKDQVTRLNHVLRGHYAYYGVAGNLQSLRKVYRAVERYWHKMLCSRSWKSYMPWEVFVQVKTRFPLLRPRLFLPYAQLKSYAVL